MSRVILFLSIPVFALAFFADQTPRRKLEAARLNNLGVAYMNQQFFEKALKNFELAAATDPTLAVTRRNKGIALLNLQRLAPAKAALDLALKADPKNLYAELRLTPTRPLQATDGRRPPPPYQ